MTPGDFDGREKEQLRFQGEVVKGRERQMGGAK